MVNVTFIIAIAFTIIALSRKQVGVALGMVIMSMFLWPEYLRIPMGVAEMSVPRIVGLAVFLKLFLNGKVRETKFVKVDSLVLFIWVWTIAATIFSGSEFSHTSQMIGRGFDTVLMYFLMRVAVTKIDDISGLHTILCWTAIMIGGVGIYEAYTAYSPYTQFIGYRTWSWIEKPPEFRYGFLRAQGSTSVPIFFGLAMMVLAGLIWSLGGYAKGQFLHKASVLIAILGALSSMSSGPWIACFMLFFFSKYQGKTKAIKLTIYGIIIVSLTLEVISNRHFYHLIDYLAIDKHTAWYRTRLLEVAVSNLGDFWLVGVGTNWPHYWAAELDGRKHIDVVNHFLIVALYGGLPALIAYIYSHVIALRSVILAWKSNLGESRRKLMFVLAATLLSLDAACMSVGLFGPPLLLSHLLLGFIVSVVGMKAEPG